MKVIKWELNLMTMSSLENIFKNMKVSIEWILKILP